LAFELFRQRRRWGRNDSTFIEISRVLVAGLSLGGITFTVLAAVSLVGPASIISLAGLVADKHWVVQHLLVAGWTAWAYALVSVTLAALAAAILPGANMTGGIHTESGWVTCFDRLPRAIQETNFLPNVPGVRLSVKLSDGSVYVGDRAEYSTDLPLEDRELILGGQLAYQLSDESATKPLTQWQRVILRGDQISNIAVQYVRRIEPAIGDLPVTSRLAWARRTCAKILARPPDSTWPKLLEAPVAYVNAAFRLLVAELFILLLTAVLSRFV
jgi:hypothetical protein